MMMFIATFFYLSQAAAAPLSFDEPSRQTYITQVLSAFSDSALTQNAISFLRTQNQYQCSSSQHQLRVQCLIEAAQANCREQRNDAAKCHLVSDVVISNLLEEGSFLDKNELRKLLRNTRGSSSTSRALSGKYARLAVDYIRFNRDRCGGRDYACLSKEIDIFCMKKSNEKAMAWQGCAGALAWFIGANSTN